MISIEQFEAFNQRVFKELRDLKGQIQELSNKLPVIPTQEPLDIVLENPSPVDFASPTPKFG